MKSWADLHAAVDRDGCAVVAGVLVSKQARPSMGEYVTLIGAEQVQSAGRSIASSAEQMERAASCMYECMNRAMQSLEGFTHTCDGLKTAMESLEAAATPPTSTEQALGSILRAWDSVDHLNRYDYATMTDWLINVMKPAIDAARGATK